MAAITADVERTKRGIGRSFVYPVAASTKIPKGAIVTLNATGFAINAVAGAGGPVVGIAVEQIDNTAGADGALKIRVDCEAEFLFTASSITQAMVGTAMLVVDNNTVDETSASSSALGKLTEFISTTRGWVYVTGLTI